MLDAGGHPRAQPVSSSATTLTRRRPMARRATRAKSLPRNRLNIGADSAAGKAPPQHHGCTWCRCRCTFWGDRCTAARQVCPDCNTTGVRIVKRGTFAACFACLALSGLLCPDGAGGWPYALQSLYFSHPQRRTVAVGPLQGDGVAAAVRPQLSTPSTRGEPAEAQDHSTQAGQPQGAHQQKPAAAAGSGRRHPRRRWRTLLLPS